VKLGALEISSDVWIVARGKAKLRALSEDLTRRRTMTAVGGLSDVIKHDLQNNPQLTAGDPAAASPRSRPTKGAEDLLDARSDC
jgi:hypothetical protein